MLKTNLQRVLDMGHFAVTTEIGPPKSADPLAISTKASLLQGYADAFNVTDNQTAVVRMSSMAGSCILKQCELEPVLQMTCRDRNRLALQADVLGASALGIHNMLFVTGDHQSKGNHPQAKGVFDIDSVQLLSIVRNMRDKGIFQNSEPLSSTAPNVFIGAVANPFISKITLRIDRLEKKINAGAQFIQTQSVFNISRFEQYMDAIRERDLHKNVHIIAGVTPLKSIKMLERMKYHVPGVDIPDDIAKRLAYSDDVEREALDITKELIEKIKSIRGVHGIHITALFWEQKIPQIVKATGLFPRPFIKL
ncbi:MAG: methylenetetrahydrofolate reductase [Candidatus Thermoplasmatota archaeon]|nr:methylenetetrahydrofolate reductase [Candidatus Thermoplasmatota archaeon]